MATLPSRDSVNTQAGGTVSVDIGTELVVPILIISSAIPSNTQTAGDFTSVCSGVLMIEDIVLETDATGIGAGGTNINITTNNAKGLTGAGNPVVAELATSLGANKTISAKAEATTKHLPFLLESGKALFACGSTTAGTGAGVLRATLLCRRMTAGATITAGGTIGAAGP